MAKCLFSAKYKAIKQLKKMVICKIFDYEIKSDND